MQTEEPHWVKTHTSCLHVWCAIGSAVCNVFIGLCGRCINKCSPTAVLQFVSLAIIPDIKIKHSWVSASSTRDRSCSSQRRWSWAGRPSRRWGTWACDRGRRRDCPRTRRGGSQMLTRMCTTPEIWSLLLNIFKQFMKSLKTHLLINVVMLGEWRPKEELHPDQRHEYLKFYKKKKFNQGLWDLLDRWYRDDNFWGDGQICP